MPHEMAKVQLSQHISNSSKVQYHSARWIKSLLAEGVRPVMTLVEQVPIDRAGERENFWIAHYKSEGFALTNAPMEREQGLSKLVVAMKNLGQDPQVRAIRSERLKKLWQNPDFRADTLSMLDSIRQSEQFKTSVSSKAKARFEAMTPEQRSELARQSHAKETPEQRSERGRKAALSSTPEERSARAKAAQAKIPTEVHSARRKEVAARYTPEEYKERLRKAWETRRATVLTEESIAKARKAIEALKAGNAKMSAEECSARSKKAYETRRANAAKKQAG